ncbi:ABC transporter ATP-binding protein [Kribbella turkmenica]|uniref:ABC transporter ATP-binding protein n=1 Tax=Kribbella turkmenica TaxID=2530375 RepID=UPI001404DFFC|nr:ABC transporter ATP-binding protein [Kribbella turkmenica]
MEGQPVNGKAQSTAYKAEPSAQNSEQGGAALTIKGVGVDYSTAEGTFTAVERVDLDIAAGEFVSIIGPSGCGKSTLLHSIGGLIPPTRGEVEFRGEVIGEPHPDRAAFVFQDYSLLPWKTTLDNVALGLQFKGVSKGERRARARDLLRTVRLEAFANSYPAELSGGMQQRAAVVRALAMDPDILLLDEPFGALDEHSRRQLGVEMAELLTTTGKILILITHSLDEAVFWGDRVVVMGASPGHVKEVMEISAPRPRAVDFMLTDEFVDARRHLLELSRHDLDGEPEPAE